MARSASLELVEATSGRQALWWAPAIALSVLALGLRDVGRWSWVVPIAGGVVGLSVPLAVRRTAGPAVWVAVTVTGLLAFAAVRTIWMLPVTGGGWAVGVAAAAAVAEEMLFRRALYGLLEAWGPRMAIAATSVTFALVHVPVYGWKVGGVDLAAGLLFGWQRWATGSWTSPALTHAAANVIQYL